jgi:hypothetical protein
LNKAGIASGSTDVQWNFRLETGIQPETLLVAYFQTIFDPFRPHWADFSYSAACTGQVTPVCDKLIDHFNVRTKKGEAF